MHSPIKNQQAIWNGLGEYFLMEIARLMSHTSTTTTVLTATSFMVACAHLKVRASLVRLPTPLSMPPTSAEGTSSTFANLTMLAMRGWENLKENECLFNPKTAESVSVYCLLGWFKKTIVFIFYMMFYMMFFMMSSCSSRFSVKKWKISYVTCLRQSQWKKLQFSWTCFFGYWKWGGSQKKPPCLRKYSMDQNHDIFSDKRHLNSMAGPLATRFRAIICL